MSKLWMIGLAASAAWTQGAIAQPAPPAPPPMAHGVHAPMPPSGPMTMHGGHRMRPHPMPGHPMPGHMPGFHRIGRGGFIPPFFMGPQFILHDWRMFGFPAPMPGAHWIRFYDDALLVDRDGRVMDGRYGWDWDRRRDRDDDRYDDEDWDDDRRGDRRGAKHRRHHKSDMVRVYRHGGPGMDRCRRRCPPVHHVPAPAPHPGYGYGYGYGCGCGGVVITETTTTTTYPVETRTYYETVTEHRAAPRRHYAKPVRRYAKPVKRAAPAPRPGERG